MTKGTCGHDIEELGYPAVFVEFDEDWDYYDIQHVVCCSKCIDKVLVHHYAMEYVSGRRSVGDVVE